MLYNSKVNMLRTHTCGELTKKEIGKNVVLCGWVDKVRTHGKIGFVNIKDRYGITQLFLGKDFQLESLRRETVIKIEGKVKQRPKANKELKTGDVEVEVSKLEVLNEASPLPLELDESVESTEETRLKYRYLDLRKQKMQDNLIMRHKVFKSMRDFFDKEGFLEIETPVLAKSTPEGARDYLVPSRIHQGKFFALPQSPQLFKQLCMVAGFDKYVQIVKCYRDEDLRADRQTEFTQLDVEMSFIDEEDIYSLMEKMIKYVWKTVLNVDLKIPFQRITYEEAMKKYKTDKPDLRKGKDEYKFVWIVDMPLLEYSKAEGRHVSAHHPFTSPKDSDIKFLDKAPEKAKAKAYDLVLNGEEIAGGSIRINKPELQKKMFKALNIGEKEAEEKFGFLLEAFKYGAPPHGGIAFGLDRVIAIICGEKSIREVIAFPKNKDARDLMLDAPSKVGKEQLDELGIRLK